ncbi:hypothetical protein ABIB25_005212 [Nakamurella sp. UYEF19]|uniref:SUMF1/EgtB/PvdO family nonheme iron enzyme n=1 Tax=Nakamurella sp. UYEF19 TaxID=1756392 RepID=UPI00339938A6
MSIAVPRVGIEGDHPTDDFDDLHRGLDVERGRDLRLPRPVDMPVVVSLSSEAAAGAVPVTGLADATEVREPNRIDLRNAKILAAPDDPASWPQWREELIRWRESILAAEPPPEAGVRARTPQPQTWAAECRTVLLCWLWDERLYRFDTDEFTPDRLLAEIAGEFGGFDAIVLWHAYPVIGLDDRNQFDFYDVPGLHGLVRWFQDHQVRVFLDYNPWDTSTNRRPGTDAEEVAAMLGRLGADGLFLDTLREGDIGLVEAVGTDRILESESRVSLEAMRTHQLSWAQWFQDSPVPGVLRAHWFDRRHMQHHTRRWNRDHSAELQSAWINGCGVLLWDNVFGTWVGWNQRDLSLHRQMRLLQREYSALLIDGEWTPLVDLGPEAAAHQVFASRFADTERSLYALVNRASEDVVVTLELDENHPAGWDLLAGTQQTIDPGRPARVTVRIPATGIGALLLTGDDDLQATLCAEAAAALPFDGSTEFPARPPVLLDPVPAVSSATPAGRQGEVLPLERAVLLEPGEHHSNRHFRRRESGMLDGAWWVDAWKPLAPDLHAEMTQDVTVLIADRTLVRTAPVTNAEFAEFLHASGYRPRNDHRFLAHWSGRRSRPGTDDEPVTFVDLEDAQAYARWRGGRLPTSAEWHLAADRESAGPSNTAKPHIRQRVWQWTADSYQEGTVRFDLLVGGTPEARGGSDWYFESGPQPPHRVAKMLRAGRGLARSAHLGFGMARGPIPVVQHGAPQVVTAETELPS